MYVVSGQAERENLRTRDGESDRGKWQELTGGQPWSETVDSVEKECGYCETAVSAFGTGLYAGQNVCIPCDTQVMDID